MDRTVLTQELSVAEGNSAGSVYPHNILVELLDLNHGTSLVPLAGVETDSILYPNVVTNS